MPEPSPQPVAASAAPLPIPRWIAGQLWAVALVAVAALVRLLLDRVTPGVLPFATFFPAVLAASVLGGWRAGLTALLLSAAVGWSLFLSQLPLHLSPAVAVNLGLFVATSAVIVGLGDYLQSLVGRQRASFARLQESEARYRTLFGSMSEGFDLCEVIRSPEGRVVDWRVLEINPALEKMIPAGPVAGLKRSQFSPAVRPEWLGRIEQVLATAEPLRFEFEGEQSGHWYEVHLNRLSPDRFCQFFIDISERKRAQALQTQLLGELNHRIKNNLQIVSALLRMQASGLEDEAARDHLIKAVSRIQAIADIHGSLEPGSADGEVEFDHYLRELCVRLGQSLLEPGKVRIEVDAGPARLSLDQAVPLGIVVNELVTNAAKYAYPDGRPGVIAVSYRPAQAGGVLTVADNGRGMAGGLDGAKSGLGLKVVKALASQLRGELRLREGPGAAFELSFGAVFDRAPAPVQPEVETA